MSRKLKKINTNKPQRLTVKRNKSSKGNTRGFRRYAFTLNNYTDEEYNLIKETAEEKGWFYILGKEVGKSGTKHIQGYIEHKNTISFNVLKKIMERAHIEKAIGNRDENYKYCSKDGVFDTNMEGADFEDKIKKIILEKYFFVKWKFWQEEVLTKIGEEPDERQINWICDYYGNTGKSFLCKYICCKYSGVIIANGKGSDIFNQVRNMLEGEVIPRIILLDIPRCNIDYINYGMIEKLKDGCFYSGKYEGGVCIFPSPHIFVFANESPELEKLSKDRWNIKNIDDEELEKLFF